MQLTLKPEWVSPGFTPDTLTDAPFVEFNAIPRFHEVRDCDVMSPQSWETLPAMARELLEALTATLDEIIGPIHLKLSGGYDSRILATLLEHELGRRPLYITDGEEEPECQRTLDFLEVPADRVYRHPMDVDDPYELASATVMGWAPIYHQMCFGPPAELCKDATLVTGLGGGEWFSYPAAGWHRTRKHRVAHVNLRAMWIDTWPQYWLLPDRWAEHYADAIHPYTTPAYAYVANGCRDEWLADELEGFPALDRVRKAMLDELDPELAYLGWKPHIYRWRLSEESAWKIDSRFYESWLYREVLDPMKVGKRYGLPSKMHDDEHACLLGGFAQWCDHLLEAGHELEVAS